MGEPTIELMLNQAAMLSRSERALLNLARAFIYNPEVLVIHNPTLQLDRQQRTNVLQALRDHVDERGLELPPESRHMRRPRTVLFSTNNMDGVKIADKILHCHDQVLEYAEEAEVKKLFYTGEGRVDLSKRKKDPSRTQVPTRVGNNVISKDSTEAPSALTTEPFSPEVEITTKNVDLELPQDAARFLSFGPPSRMCCMAASDVDRGNMVTTNHDRGESF